MSPVLRLILSCLFYSVLVAILGVPAEIIFMSVCFMFVGFLIGKE